MNNANRFDFTPLDRSSFLNVKATFTYWFQGYGWPSNEPRLEEKPTKKVVVRCDGPDSGYIGTAGLLLKSILDFIIHNILRLCAFISFHSLGRPQPIARQVS